MENQVKLNIVKFKDGSVIKASESKKGQSYMRVETPSAIEFVGNNIVDNSRSCLVYVSTKIADALKTKLVEGADLNALFTALAAAQGGTYTPKKIIVVESTEKAYATQAFKINPSNNTPVLTAEGKNIYRSTELGALDAQDVFIASAKTGAITLTSASAEAFAE